MTRMHNPPHPGETLQDTVLREDGGLTVTDFAKRLGVSRVALSRVVNGRAACQCRAGHSPGRGARELCGIVAAPADRL